MSFAPFSVALVSERQLTGGLGARVFVDGYHGDLEDRV